MYAREAARQTAGEPPYARRGARGGLAVVRPGNGAARGGSRLPEHSPRETRVALAPVGDGSVPRACLLWAAAALLLEVIAHDAPGDPDASALPLERDLRLAESDRALFPALIHLALGLFERRAAQGPAEAALAAEIAGLLGDAKASAPAPGGPARPGERLTESETRVLRYLPTHLGSSEIAAELFLSPNTVKTHQRHLYRKLGAHSRREAVQRARAVGLLAGSSGRS